MSVTQIVTRLIKDAAVTTAKVAANAITLGLMGWGTAKGDLLVAQSSTVYANLAVGSDGFLLTADSTQANGIKWAANAALLAANFVFNEVPSGTVNGTNPTFTLANTPTSGTVRLYVDGIRMNPGAGNDYTMASGTITFNAGAIPQTGDVILADYMH